MALQQLASSFASPPTEEDEPFPLDGRNGVHPPSYAARVRASRGHKPQSLFDRVPDRDEPQTPAADRPSPAAPLLPPAPPGALNDATLTSPPGIASGNSVPPEGLPQFPLAMTLRSRLGLIPLRAVRPRWRGRSRKEKETTSCPAPSWPYRYPHHHPHRPPSPAARRQKARDILTAIRTLQEHRAGPAARHAGGEAGPRPLRRLRRRRALASSPTPSPAATRTPPGRPSAKNSTRCLHPRNTPAPSAPPTTRFTLLNRHAGDAPGPRTPRRSHQCHGAGTGLWYRNFMAHAPSAMRFIGVELDSISGRIAGRCTPARHPDREFPRHQIARARRGDRQRPLRR